MPKKTLKSLEAEIATLREHRDMQRRDFTLACNDKAKLVDLLQDAKAKIDELTRDKRWLQQLSSEQSRAIAGYMGSR